MANSMNLNVRLGGSLSEFVSQNIDDDGDYDNVSEYIRDLIRQDKKRKEEHLFLTLKAELQQSFNALESDYVTLNAKDIIDRNANKI